jgi:anaerobic ribonucleoside-triphosphate reductase activating protein
MLDTNIRISGVAEDSIVDGPGLRFVIFVQGCNMHCEGCHNPQTWDNNGGYDITIRELIDRIERNPLTDGITLSGGEPFLQAKKLSLLLDELNLPVISYTGYTYEWLVSNATDDNSYLDLLHRVDYLIDGPYIESERSYDLLFRGSRNQRIIDVKASMDSGSIVLSNM